MDLTLPGKIRVFHLGDKFGIREARTHGVSRACSPGGFPGSTRRASRSAW
jgi:hypothetical protein